MKKRSKIIIAIAVPVILAAAVITVFAYIQNRTEQTNEFSIGEDVNTVSEVFTEPEDVGMNNTFRKEVSVVNSGTSDQFVRVYLDFSDSLVRDKSKIVYTKNNVSQQKSWSEFIADQRDDWEFVPETSSADDAILRGYFYYKGILQPGEKTPNLIDGVVTDFSDDPDESNPDKITDFDIVVYSETVQTTEINENGTEYTGAQWKQAWKSFLNTPQQD